MKALICPNSSSDAGYRVAEVHAIGFDVAPPLFWVDCADDVMPDSFYYDPADETIKPISIPEPQTQPTVEGAETL